MTDMAKEALELLPCPFCGGATKYNQDVPHPFHYVWCDICGIQTPAHSTKEPAIAAWNTRAPSPELARVTAERDRMREVLEAAAPVVCSYCCPTVKKTGDEWLHADLCRHVNAALSPATPTEKEPNHGVGFE